ncbi:hypothetical protein BDB00DRAFT_790966 [Zychaea mexicana]|uniref:uncharacterized protein n=1 Tax=Zychaea mexicana TaxID=64656 RepID=UPI0022FDBBC5|nr:uncharacterized protein BDB00DRAFT_790966 [Zychaea mexicana]KAI9489542.1 hypothetical protein BDB00DRAFT_790966 [Zychaea mexicana]
MTSDMLLLYGKNLMERSTGELANASHVYIIAQAGLSVNVHNHPVAPAAEASGSQEDSETATLLSRSIANTHVYLYAHYGHDRETSSDESTHSRLWFVIAESQMRTIKSTSIPSPEGDGRGSSFSTPPSPLIVMITLELDARMSLKPCLLQTPYIGADIINAENANSYQ